MRTEETPRGFSVIVEEKYQNQPGEFTRLIQESSAVGDYEDSFENPGSSFLWIGEDHHLDRAQVKELIGHMQYWLDNRVAGEFYPPSPHTTPHAGPQGAVHRDNRTIVG